jgi:hypothetical protein
VHCQEQAAAAAEGMGRDKLEYPPLVMVKTEWRTQAVAVAAGKEMPMQTDQAATAAQVLSLSAIKFDLHFHSRLTLNPPHHGFLHLQLGY